jgi:hypothetical protein
MKILTLLARFGTERYAGAETRLCDLFRTQLPHVRHDLVVIDNALPRGVVEDRAGVRIVGGDNRSWEFSAWNLGVELAGRSLRQYDLVHFATSAFDQLYAAYLTRFTPATLAAVAGRPMCLGHIDCYNHPIRVLAFRSQHWVRTSFFFLPPAEVELLGSVVSLADRDALFSHDPDRPFLDDAPLSRRYRAYIVDWLTGRDLGQGVTWHSSFALDESRLPLFEQKAITILNEHLLSIRLRAAGCRLVDVTWLATVLRDDPSCRVNWETSWREQVTRRAWDAVRPPDTADDAGDPIA